MRRVMMVVALGLGGAVPLQGQQVLYTFHGDASMDYFGIAVNDAGDVNQDGYADVIVGAYFDEFGQSDIGKARVFSGQNGAALYTFSGAPEDYFGSTVSGAGDVNQDGFDDLIVGAWQDDTTASNAGKAVVFSGKTGLVLSTFLGAHFEDYFGYSVNRAGDVNADGYPDVIVGAYGEDHNGSQSGSARIYSGKTGGLLYTLYGSSADDQFGKVVSGAGDVNQDGFDDVIIGAPHENLFGSNVGFARVYSGKTGAQLYVFVGDTLNDQFGFAVSGVGDVDQDGFDDMMVGAVTDDVNGTDSGSAFVYSGKTGATLFTFRGDDPFDYLGLPVSDVGDVDLDGTPDVALGIQGDDVNGSGSGSVRLYSGTTGLAMATLSGDGASDLLGIAMSGAGDVNQDGFPDLIAGAPHDDDTGADAGLARVYALCQASWNNYGKGWPGTNGVPRLIASAPPELCTSINIIMSNSRGATTAGTLFIGFAPAQLPTAWDGTMLLIPGLAVPLSIPSGGLTLPANIPCDQALCGFISYLQVLEADPGASKGVSFSRGLRLVHGF